MNRVEISGRLTRDPEVRYLGNTRFPVLTMNVAVDDGSGRYNRESRKSEYGSGFYQVEVAGVYGESLGRMVSRGDEVYVVGSLSQFTTQPKGEGESKTHTRIRAVMVVPLVAAPSGGGGFAAPPEPEFDPWGAPQGGDAGTF